MARKKSVSAPTSFSFPYTVMVPVASHRRWPDPVFPDIQHHSGYVPALLYPANGFPNDPNLRPPNIDRQIYRDIAKSLLNEECTPNTYHLKSKGEIQAAATVRELNASETDTWFEENVRPLIGDEDLYQKFRKKYTLLEVTYTEKQGILDGGHTDRIWSDPETLGDVQISFSSDSGRDPVENHLPVEWITGIPDDVVAEIVGGRNTAMQVQAKTLANHEQLFEWIKNLIASEPFADKIAYRENESRTEKPVDIRELLALIAPFNRDIYSLEGESNKRLPVSAFSQKQAVLDAYIDDQEHGKSFCRLRGILKDILALHDLIHLEAVDLYNRAKKRKGEKGMGGKFTFVDHHDPEKKGKAGKPHAFVFTGKTGWDRLADGALYPILAAFSALVTKEANGDFAWSTTDGFEGVKRIWREFAADFVETTANKSAEVGRNPAQIGKSTNHWEFLYLKIKMKATTDRL